MYDQQCNRCGQRVAFCGSGMAMFFASQETAIAEEVAWDFLNKAFNTTITFTAYCTTLSEHYATHDPSMTFMSPGLFLKAWFGWASKRRIDFREVCGVCGHHPRQLACDGTKLGVAFRHSNITPIEVATQHAATIPCKHRRNERSFIAYESGTAGTQEKRDARQFLAYLCKRYGGVEVEIYGEDDMEAKTELLLHSIPLGCRPLVEQFSASTLSAPLMQALCPLLRILSSDRPVSSLLPFRFLPILNRVIDGEDTYQVNDFSPEVAKVLQIAKEDSNNAFSTVCDFFKCVIQSCITEVHQDNSPVPEPRAITGSYNPEKNGMAYYFTPTGEKVREMRKYDVGEDKGEATCKKKYPEVSRSGTTYLFLWFDPAHYGHCYGFHVIPVAEGRKDAFASLYTHMPTAPTEVFYDFACQLEEYCLNREPDYFMSTRFFHDIFHGYTHKCPEVYKSQRIASLQSMNTEVCEQFNAFIQ